MIAMATKLAAKIAHTLAARIQEVTPQPVELRTETLFLIQVLADAMEETRAESIAALLRHKFTYHGVHPTDPRMNVFTTKIVCTCGYESEEFTLSGPAFYERVQHDEMTHIMEMLKNL